ncbi:MAG: T9SS type A sorting domain-containing protein, partial [Prevotella sp.]|nr:T9SS type A sorting domain-containing protein [Prevotella sp.]
VFKDYYYKMPGKWLDDYSTTVTLPYYGAAPDYGAYEAGWERPTYELTTLPVNDGTLPDADEITTFGDKNYQKKLLINDYLFQDATLSDEVSQYIYGAATGNQLLPTYYGKSGTYPTKPGSLYGGATKGAYKIAKSDGYIEFSVPSLSEMHSNCYGGGKNSTLQMQWKRPGENSWHDGESFTTDQRVFTADFVAYGVPQTEEPIIVRINSTGSNDMYLTDLTLNGFEEYKGDDPTAVHLSTFRSQLSTLFTSNGIIAYGDIASITIYDTAGMQVASSVLSQFCNLANLGQGLYTAVIIAKDGTKTVKKFIRQ